MACWRGRWTSRRDYRRRARPARRPVRRPSRRRRGRGRCVRRAALRGRRRRRWPPRAAPARWANDRPVLWPPGRRGAPASTCATSRRGPARRARGARPGARTARGSAPASCRSRCPGRQRCARDRFPRPRRLDSLAQERRDLRGDIAVHRLGLHRSRRAAHVHQADAAARVRSDEIERTRRSQRGDVVDDVDAEIQRDAHDLDLGRVDRDRNSEADRRCEHRPDAGELFLDAHWQRTRTARLAADVEDVGALGEHLLAAGDRLRRRQSRAAFGERVWRDVDDAHHARPREVDREPARPPDRAAHEKRGRSPVSKRLASIALRRLPARCPASPAARCRST